MQKREKEGFIQRLKQLSLSRQLLVGMVILALASLFFVFVLVNTAVHDIVYENVIELTQRDNELQAERLDSWLQTTVQIIDDFSALLLSLGLDYIDIFEANLLESYPFLDGIYLGFSDGSLRGFGGWQPDDDWDSTLRPWYIDAINADGATVISKPYISLPTGELVTAVARDLGLVGGLNVVFSADIHLWYIVDLIEQFEVHGGGYMFLIDEDGEILTHPAYSLVPTVYGFHNVFEHPAYSDVFAYFLNGQEATQGIDYFGNAAYFLSISLPNFDWKLITVVPAAVIGASIWQDLWIMLVIVFVVIAIIFSLNFSYARWISIAAVQKEQALEADLNKRFQAVLNSSPFICAVFDMQGNVVDATDATIAFFELDSNKVPFSTFADLLPEYQTGARSSLESLEVIRSRFHLMTKTGESIDKVEWLLYTSKGEARPIEISMTPVKFDGEDFILAYAFDLRDRYELAKALEEARVANMAKSRFLAQMSHEIRTPMNSVLGITNLLLQTNNHPKKTQDALLRIYDSSKILLNVINDILDLSKVEAGKMEIFPASYDTSSLIADVAQLNAMFIGNKKIDFRINASPDLPAKLIGDELRIKQILNNLLSNAFKYTEAGIVSLKVSFKDEQLIFVVSDTGQGMTKEQVEHLSDMEFIRFNTASNRTIQGTGLGLSIINQLILMMDGELFVESNLSHGSSFTVHLPQKADGSAILGVCTAEYLGQHQEIINTDGSRAHFKTSNTKKGKVLIVDDAEANLFVAEGFLRLYPVTIELARSGFEAVQKVKDGNVYDIIFMDHMMPEMDGVEAVVIMREMGYSCPIVALTANAVGDARRMFLESGFDDFVAKPINAAQLDTCLLRFLGEEKAQKESPVPTDSLARAVLHDIQRVLFEIEKATQGDMDEDEFVSYTTLVHSMKSVMPLIGQNEMAGIANKLEEAGQLKDQAFIKTETPAFVQGLKDIAIKLESSITSSKEMLSEDKGFLQEQMQAIAKASEECDITAAMTAIGGIRQKPRSSQTEELLDKIDFFILHGDFEKAAKLANDFRN